MKKISVCLTLIVVLFLLSSVSVSAITGSLGNARMIISSDQYEELNDLNGKDVVTIERTILVRNVNNVPLNITLIVDDESDDFLELIDESFVLEPANGDTPSERKARFNINIKKFGGYDGQINVLFTPIGVDEPGVALSSTIVVNAKGEGSSGEIDDEENQDGEENDPLLSGDENSGVSKGVMILGVSTIVLLVILIVLMRLAKKKKGNKENEVIKESEMKSNIETIKEKKNVVKKESDDSKNGIKTEGKDDKTKKQKEK